MERRWKGYLVIVMVVMTASSFSVANVDRTDDWSVSPDRFKMMIDRHRGDADVVLLDIRTPGEYESGHIDGAVLMDYYAHDFADRIKALDWDKTYLIYCRSGNRSGRSLTIFRHLGFTRTFHLDTGIKGWLHHGYKVVR